MTSAVEYPPGFKQHLKDVFRRFPNPDFSVTQYGNEFHLNFTEDTPFAPPPEYTPTLAWDPHHRTWSLHACGIKVYSYECPLLEALVELRGYFLLGLPGPNDVILDAGPFTGFTGLFAAKLASLGQVLFLEPDPESLKYLSANILLNNASNTRILPKGLARDTGKARFTPGPSGTGLLQDSPGARFVDTVSLKDVAQQHAPQGFSFIKTDIEGAEAEIMDDLFAAVENSPGTVAAIASYHIIDGRKTSMLLEQAAETHPALKVATLFPFHETTFIVHNDNTPARDKLLEFKKITQP